MLNSFRQVLIMKKFYGRINTYEIIITLVDNWRNRNWLCCCCLFLLLYIFFFFLHVYIFLIILFNFFSFIRKFKTEQCLGIMHKNELNGRFRSIFPCDGYGYLMNRGREVLYHPLWVLCSWYFIHLFHGKLVYLQRLRQVRRVQCYSTTS